MPPTLADSSLAQAYYMKETTWGTIPALPLKAFRFTGESLKANIARTESEEIRSDRQVTDLITTRIGAGGDLNFELSHGAQDDFLEGLLFDVFSADLGISATDIDAAAADQSFNTAGAVDFSAIQPGRWIKVAGFSNSANNGFFRVVSATATKLIVSQGDFALVNEAAGPTVTMQGKNLRNGTTKQSFTIEKRLTDVPQFINYRGMRVASGNLNVEVGRPVGGAFAFLGKQELTAVATVGTGADVAAPTNDVMNAVTSLQTVREAGVVSAFSYLSLALTIENGLREQPAIGSAFNIGIGAGTMKVSGRLRAYFSGPALYDKFLNDTPTDLSLRFVDPSGKAYILSLLKMKFATGQVLAAARNQDVLADLTFTAFRDPTFGKTVQIDRFV